MSSANGRGINIRRGGEMNMTLTRRITTAVATGTLLLNAFTSSAFAATIQISGNGDSSSSNAAVNISQNTVVTQNNVANITNNVNADANTGGNDANKNNGGNVTIDTGNANTTVNVTNNANTNVASVDCCGVANNVSVNISDNAGDTTNNASLNLTNNTTVYQNNDAYVTNNVDADAKTGYNEANKNNGGDVEITTGNATTNVSVNTTANVNSATIGSDNGSSSGGSLSLWIKDNGYGSTNDIAADLDNSVDLTQLNDAYVYNDVDADAKTGKNEANKNNGGNVLIDTGNATSKVVVDNNVNFNFADVDCGCLLEDWIAKIADNAGDSENEIVLDLLSDRTDFQQNDADLDNDVDQDAKTGDNEGNKNNAGSEDHDPEIETGDAVSNTSVNNEGNTNIDGASSPDFPEVEFDNSINLSLILAWLGVHV